MIAEENKIEFAKAVKSAKDDMIALANLIIESSDAIVRTAGDLAMDEDPAIYLYNGRCYDMLMENNFYKLLYDFFNNYELTKLWKLTKMNEIRLAIEASDKIKTVEMDIHEHQICLKNGILDLKTMELIPHSPDYYFTTYVNVDYNAEDKNAPHFVEFLKTTFDDLGYTDTGTIDNIIKIGGYLLYPQNKLNLMFLFLGGGANGKSLLLEVFQMFFNKRNVSFLDLSTLSSHTSLERERIIGSRLNITSEAKGTEIDSEMVKKVISGEGIEVTRKFRKPISYRPICKLVVASNDAPYFNDTSHGIFRRIFPITFRNEFMPADQYRFVENAKQKRIFQARDYIDMTNEFTAEKSAILNLFLEGLKMLIEAGWTLSPSSNSKTTKQEYKDVVDKARAFLEENYVKSDTESTDIVYILEDYRVWYKMNVSEKSLNLSSVTLGKKIKELFRVEPVRLSRYGNGKQNRSTTYKIRRRTYDDDLKGFVSNDGSNRGVGEQPEAVVLAADPGPSPVAPQPVEEQNPLFRFN